MATIIETFKQFLQLYNDAVTAGQYNQAIVYAKQIADIAQTELANPRLDENYRVYYQNSLNNVKTFVNAYKNGNLRSPAEAAARENKPVNPVVDKNWFADDVPDLRLSDIAGLSDVIQELFVNVLAPGEPKYSEIYKRYRKDMGLQILLYGPPGTGKTHIVKCLAGQLGCKIAVVQVKDFMANLVGDGEKIIAAVFEQAKQYDKCIIFFDEIDALAENRESDGSRYTKGQLTTLLTNMDGFTSKTKEGQIRIIVAATNRPWVLDSAVKRGGRFETQIYIPLPDIDARKKLIAIAMGKDEKKSSPDIPFAPDVSVDWLAKMTQGYAGADIKAICKQIVNRPLTREIYHAYDPGKYPSGPFVTREDCEIVLRKYINSITDEMLVEFDAYKYNVTKEKYISTLLELVNQRKFENIPVYALRYIQDNLSKLKPTE